METNKLQGIPENVLKKKVKEAILAKYRDELWFIVEYNQTVILSNISNMQEKIIISESTLTEWFISAKIELAFQCDMSINASLISCSQIQDTLV